MRRLLSPTSNNGRGPTVYENDVAESATAESREEWFWGLVSYMKFRTLAVWLYYYPETRFEDFEFIWPMLFDQMLSHATRATMKSLAQFNTNAN